jgi:hypothetical protein
VRSSRLLSQVLPELAGWQPLLWMVDGQALGADAQKDPSQSRDAHVSSIYVCPTNLPISCLAPSPTAVQPTEPNRHIIISAYLVRLVA